MWLRGITFKSVTRSVRVELFFFWLRNICIKFWKSTCESGTEGTRSVLRSLRTCRLFGTKSKLRDSGAVGENSSDIAGDTCLSAMIAPHFH